MADPRFGYNVNQFPPNVVPDSQIGNQFYADYFNSVGVPSQSCPFGNTGTDSNSFALIGIPDTGILTRQDCCKGSAEVALWGGYLGNYEGNIPSFDGGCVDRPNLWCDDLSNNDPAVLALASKATAYVTFQTRVSCTPLACPTTATLPCGISLFRSCILLPLVEMKA